MYKILLTALPSIACLFHLWIVRRNEPIGKKTWWTFVIGVPIFGPLFYLSSFDGSPPETGAGEYHSDTWAP